jgi:hypothetical protein
MKTATSGTESPKPALTSADAEALALLPESGWFEFRSLPFNRPNYRCERLELAGALSRVWWANIRSCIVNIAG